MGRKAAHCTGLHNYCCLRRVQQIYGQGKESSIPTLKPHARIKLTICNLNRLNTPASREKHNQPGRVPQEINSKARCLLPLSLSVSVFLTISLSTHFLLSLTGWTIYPLARLQSLQFTLFCTFLFLITGPIWSCLSSKQRHLTWQRFPLSKEWNHLSGNRL